MKPLKPWMKRLHRYLSARRDAKGKAAFSSNSKLMPGKYWNESKRVSLSWITLRLNFSVLKPVSENSAVGALPRRDRYIDGIYAPQRAISQLLIIPAADAAVH
jgi:hypothetical protein